MEWRLGLMLPRSHVAIVPLRRLGRCRLGPPLRMTVSSKPNSLCELDAVGGAQCSAWIVGEFLDRKLLTATPVRMLVGGRWQIHLVRLVGQIVDLDHRYRGPRSREEAVHAQRRHRASLAEPGRPNPRGAEGVDQRRAGHAG